MAYPIVIIAFFLASFNVLKPSEKIIYFDVVHKNNIVGRLKATKIEEGTTIHYQSSTSISTRIIREINVNYDYDVVFNAGLLQKSDVKITVNDKIHAETSTVLLDNTYHIKKDAKDIPIAEAIQYSTIQLYFEEPKHISKCYSEQDGSFNSIVNLGNQSYKKTNAKGRENIYTYKEGELMSATIDGGFVSFQIIARE
ncbi:hypothetical protein SCB49_03564 [unidentified eubacterium SCB49]|nr:hypothetical protein SCB49_03564 [unidentified eubacterium SCB49]